MTQNVFDNEYALRPLVTKNVTTMHMLKLYVEMGLAYPPGVKNISKLLYSL